MPEFFEQDNERGLLQRYLSSWRVVISAWAIGVMVVLSFGGVQAFASRHTPTVRPHAAVQQQLLGAMIPRHDPSCAESGAVTASATPNCRVIGNIFERAEAEAEAGTTPGF